MPHFLDKIMENNNLIDIYINPNYEYMDIFQDEINTMTLELNGKYMHENGKKLTINVHIIGDKFDDDKHGEYNVAVCQGNATWWYSKGLYIIEIMQDIIEIMQDKYGIFMQT